MPANKPLDVAPKDERAEVATHDEPHREPSLAPVIQEKVEEHAEEKFTLGTRGVLVFVTLAILSLVWALDGSSISVALPVRLLIFLHISWH